jgi:hypothetical protein
MLFLMMLGSLGIIIGVCVLSIVGVFDVSEILGSRICRGAWSSIFSVMVLMVVATIGLFSNKGTWTSFCMKFFNGLYSGSSIMFDLSWLSFWVMASFVEAPSCFVLIEVVRSDVLSQKVIFLHLRPLCSGLGARGGSIQKLSKQYSSVWSE